MVYPRMPPVMPRHGSYHGRGRLEMAAIYIIYIYNIDILYIIYMYLYAVWPWLLLSCALPHLDGHDVGPSASHHLGPAEVTEQAVVVEQQRGVHRLQVLVLMAGTSRQADGGQGQKRTQGRGRACAEGREAM